MVCFDGLPLYKDSTPLTPLVSLRGADWHSRDEHQLHCFLRWCHPLPSFGSPGSVSFLNHSTRRVQTCHVSDVGFQ